MKSQSLLYSIIFSAIVSLGWSVAVTSLAAQEVVSFERDIKPILERRCLQCHGEDLSEADLNMTDHDIVADYLEAGDPASSDLYDVLVNEERLMPPEDDGGPLPAGEIALIRLWIEEGASWPEGVTVGEAEEPVTISTTTEPETPRIPPSQRPLAEKIWAFHGYFHPAVVHFPVALLTVAALFVLLHWVFKGNYREFAFYLLLLGALGSIVACTMGWAFAPERSMGGGIFDMSHKVFNHRWLGIVTAVLTSVLTLVALRARKSNNRKVQFGWQAGIIVAAALVGIVGHQGGELVYGEGMYDKAFAKYFAPAVSESDGNTDDEPTTDQPSDSGDGTTDQNADDTTPDSQNGTDETTDPPAGETTDPPGGETTEDLGTESAPPVEPPESSGGDNTTEGVGAVPAPPVKPPEGTGTSGGNEGGGNEGGAGTSGSQGTGN